MPINTLQLLFKHQAPLNEAVGNLAVILRPSLKGNNPRFQSSQSSLQPPSNPFLMNRATSFVIWNITGANNDDFRHTFRDVIDNHHPCIVALLGTRMTSHLPHKDSFNYTNMLEVTAQGQSGGIVILWDDNPINMTQISTSN